MPWMNPDIHDASQVLKGKEKKMRIDEDVHHGVVISWPTSPPLTMICAKPSCSQQLSYFYTPPPHTHPTTQKKKQCYFSLLPQQCWRQPKFLTAILTMRTTPNRIDTPHSPRVCKALRVSVCLALHIALPWLRFSLPPRPGDWPPSPSLLYLALFSHSLALPYLLEPSVFAFDAAPRCPI